MKKAFSVLLVFMLSVSLFAIPSDDAIQNSANELGVPFDDLKAYVNTFYPESPSSEVLEVTVQQYLKDFDDNSFSAYQKYKDRPLRLTITIEEIYLIIFFHIRSEESYGYTHMSFEIDENYENILGTLKKGDRIVVEGYLADDDSLGRTKIIQIL